MYITDTQLAASNGASLVGFIQSGAGAEAQTVQDRLRDTVHASDFGYGKVGNNAAQNAGALQAAIDRGSVILPAGNVDIGNTTIVVPPGTVVQGQSTAASIVTCSGDPSFLYQAPNGTAVIQGPKFIDLSISCSSGSALRLNSEAGGFTDDSCSQSFITIPRFERLKINGPGAGTGIGLELNKSFHVVLDQVEIAGFEIGVLVRGCDFPRITNGSRIWACDTLIEAISMGNMGSGLLVDGCDLLLPSVSFIKSSDRDLMVKNSYLEKQNLAPLSGPVFDLENVYSIHIAGNRIETPASVCPEFLAVSGNGSSFVFENNVESGEEWGASRWNVDENNFEQGARYHFNPTIRQKILFSGNFNLAHLPPFITDDAPALPAWNDLWRFSPSLPGVRPNYYYAKDIVCRDQAFVFPPEAEGNFVAAFRNHSIPLPTNVSIHVLAKSVVLDQVLNASLYSGDSPTAFNTNVELTTGYAWYTLFTNVVAPAGMEILLWNADTTRNDDALVRQIVVTRA